MADIEKLKQLIASDDRFKGKTPDEIFAIGSTEDQPIPIVPPKTTQSTWAAAGLGAISPADIAEAVSPPKKYRSPDGAPGSYHVQPEGNQFRLYWDFKPQSEAPLFDTADDAEAWQKQWYADHPPVEVAADIAVVDEIVKP